MSYPTTQLSPAALAFLSRLGERNRPLALKLSGEMAPKHRMGAFIAQIDGEPCTVESVTPEPRYRQEGMLL